MNQGRIWCVVNPTVGLPLFIGGVAVTSLIVHTAVLTNTDWMARFFQGASKAKTAAAESASPIASTAAGPGFTVTVTPTAASDQAALQSFAVTVTPAAQASSAQTLVMAVPSASSERIQGTSP